jgi:hypothetical protein
MAAFSIAEGSTEMGTNLSDYSSTDPTFIQNE